MEDMVTSIVQINHTVNTHHKINTMTKGISNSTDSMDINSRCIRPMRGKMVVGGIGRMSGGGGKGSPLEIINGFWLFYAFE